MGCVEKFITPSIHHAITDVLRYTTYMKFFIPHTTGTDQENMVYTKIKANARESTGWDIHREKVYSLEYTFEGTSYIAEVGKIEKRQGEEVIAILASNTYLIFTRNRGLIRGGPIKVGQNEVTKIELFEDN